MKLIRIVGSCLVVVLALGMVVASSAYAGGEAGVCEELKVKPFTGAYLDKDCLTPASPQQKAAGTLNKHEWKPMAANTKYSSTEKKMAVKNNAPVPESILVCKTTEDSGEWTSPASGLSTLKYTGCTGGGKPCHTVGEAAASEIITSEPNLKSRLVVNGEKGPGTLVEPAAGEAWLAFEKPAGANVPLFRIECPAELLPFMRITGAFGGKITEPNKITPKLIVEFAPGKGEQALLVEQSANQIVWTNPGAPGAFTVTEKQEIKAPNGDIEVKS